MLPRGVRLYTWIDVEQVLGQLRKQGKWPKGLVWVQAYWDGLTLGVRSQQDEDEILRWLNQQFEPRFEQEDRLILLEALQSSPRRLPVRFELVEEDPTTPRPFVPSLARPTMLWHNDTLLAAPQPLEEDLPPVVAFHSFKGGVGRTLHLLALARILTAPGTAMQGAKILVVDADLEAPGITWLLRSRLPDLPISFADLLALVHGDPAEEADSALELVAERLQEVFIENIYVLPAFRSGEQFGVLDVRPEHLIRGASNPFFLTSLLARLGQAVGAEAVLVDLRAGLSDLSAGLLLDPRVYRVFVTTLSGQSVAGTRHMLRFVGQQAPSSGETDPIPAIVIAQVPKDLLQSETLQATEEALLSEVQTVAQGSDGAEKDLGSEPDAAPAPPCVITPLDPRLLTLPLSWSEAIEAIDQSLVMEPLKGLADWLPDPRTARSGLVAERNVKDARRRLHEVARRLIYAEQTTDADSKFLPTLPLQRLVADHRRQVPLVVMIGSKGAGKTYTFTQMMRSGTWKAFAAAAGELLVTTNAYFFPLLQPRNMAEGLRVNEIRKQVAESLQLGPPASLVETGDLIREAVSRDLDETGWRERWLDLIAWSIGHQPGTNGAGRSLPGYLASRGQRIVVVVDGLEDYFQTLASSDREQTALRALLQAVPEWLYQQPDRTVGLVLFMRRDMVGHAIRQNLGQYLARYEAYELRWDRQEALRLVLWIVSQANLLNVHEQEVLSVTERQLIEHLVPVWGRKLGRDRSKEARSHEWVLAALSNLRGELQARDLVRFLALAAELSIDVPHWDDRVLAPQAMRKALPECSSKKIEELGEENPKLGELLNRLRNLNQSRREIPFTRDQVEFSAEEMQLLEASGVVLRDDDGFFMPEIFRLGLGFSLKSGARPRVLTLARRARRSL